MIATTNIESSLFYTREYTANPYPTLKLLRDQQPFLQRSDAALNFSASPHGEYIGAVFGRR